MAPTVRSHLPLFTTRIHFEFDDLPPLPDTMLRADLTEKTRQNLLPPLPSITLRADLTRMIRRKRHAVRSPYERVARCSSVPRSRPREPTPLHDSHAESRGGSPLTSIDGSDDSEGETPPPLPKRRQIPKPPGEAGRRNCGGFNLESVLNWERNKYKRMMVRHLFRTAKPMTKRLFEEPH